MPDVLELITAMQEENGGRGYTTPLAEIRAGQKTTHWIWWIWPSLKGVRSTSKPHLELPDLNSAANYLKHPTLCGRLVEITDVAQAHLARGVKPNVLFGSSTDVQKFQNCMAVFAIAAVDSGASPEVQSCFVRALRTLPPPHDGLGAAAVDVLNRSPSPSVSQSINGVKDAVHSTKSAS